MEFNKAKWISSKSTRQRVQGLRFNQKLAHHFPGSVFLHHQKEKLNSEFLCGSQILLFWLHIGSLLPVWETVIKTHNTWDCPQKPNFNRRNILHHAWLELCFESHRIQQCWRGHWDCPSQSLLSPLRKPKLREAEWFAWWPGTRNEGSRFTSHGSCYSTMGSYV